MKFAKKSLLFAVILSVALSACNFWGSEVVHNKLHIYYKNGATVDDANKLKDYLVKSKFEHGQEQAVQISKKGDTCIFKMVVAEGSKIDEMGNVFKIFAADLSTNVFKGKPVRMDLCNNLFKTLKSFDSTPIPADAVTKDGMKHYDDGSYELTYPASWTKSDASSSVKLMLISPEHNSTINFVTEDATGQNIDLAGYLALNLKNLNATSSTSNLHIIENSRQQGTSGAYQKLVYTANISKSDMYVQQYLFVTKTAGVVLTYVIPKASQNAAALKTATDIMDSFVLK